MIDKVHEEVSELQVELESTDQERISDEVGDLLFTIVNVARWRNVDPEDALRRMIDRFTARFRRIEETAVESGRSMEEITMRKWTPSGASGEDGIQIDDGKAHRGRPELGCLHPPSPSEDLTNCLSMTLPVAW